MAIMVSLSGLENGSVPVAVGALDQFSARGLASANRWK
jgi:hypothetical protein